MSKPNAKKRGRPNKRIELWPGDRQRIEVALSSGVTELVRIRLRLLLKAAEGETSISDLGDAEGVQLSPARVQFWLDKYEEHGLEFLFREQRRLPRGPLHDFNHTLWLLAGVETKNVANAQQGVAWLAKKGCVVPPKAVRTWLKRWKDETGGENDLQRKLWLFMTAFGYVGSIAEPECELVLKAHQQLVAYLQEIGEAS